MGSWKKFLSTTSWSQNQISARIIFSELNFALPQIKSLLIFRAFKGRQSSFGIWQKNLVWVCILFWLIFPHHWLEIPLAAYHSIQKEKPYLFGQEIKGICSFLITRDLIFEKISSITSKLWKRKPKYSGCFLWHHLTTWEINQKKEHDNFF